MEASVLRKLLRLLKVIALVLGVIGGVITVIDYASRPRDKLTAEVGYTPFALPAPVLKELDEFSPATSLRACWIANVHNQGKTTLREVTMTLPYTKYVSIARKGSEAVERESVELIPLGALRPNETVNVVAWTPWPLSGFDLQKVELVHASGTGSVEAIVPVGRVGQWAESVWETLVFGRWTFLGLLVWAAIQIWSMTRSAPKRGDHPPPRG